jgi:hypothetical protein
LKNVGQKWDGIISLKHDHKTCTTESKSLGQLSWDRNTHILPLPHCLSKGRCILNIVKWFLDIRNTSSACYLLSRWFIFQPLRWRRHVPLRHCLTFNGLHSIISQKTELSSTGHNYFCLVSWILWTLRALLLRGYLAWYLYLNCQAARLMLFLAGMLTSKPLMCTSKLVRCQKFHNFMGIVGFEFEAKTENDSTREHIFRIKIIWIMLSQVYRYSSSRFRCVHDSVLLLLYNFIGQNETRGHVK